ncbi:MAG: anhydro-N-acetylmuramic acid kinase [Candidatus Eremiobacteraeota bacterium]|nr:anhydro-N-acetylmuramic acid kinase [Candidatus Eremiobacteraeota bacterium]
MALGMMSGTSLDGIDCALVDLQAKGERMQLEVLDARTFAFDTTTAGLLDEIVRRGGSDLSAIARLHRALGLAHADTAERFLRGRGVDFAAMHGQTIFHDGAAALTLQIGDPFALRERIAASVCFDFRSADCALGGSGAPLVPYVDALVLADPIEKRVALNCGGIANVTLLAPGARPEDENVVAFDTGPGNMLLDAWVREASEGRAAYDDNGEGAARGTLDASLLASMLDDPYFTMVAPKSTGRERFGEPFLNRFREDLRALALDDALATLLALTVESIAMALELHRFADARILCSGGGARNGGFLRALGRRLSRARVETSDAVGMPVDAKEAIAFAVLGYETLRERSANLPSVTGARKRTVLGAIAPHELPALLAKIAKETAR